MPQLFGFDRVAIRGPRPLPLVGVPQRLFKFLDDPVGVALALRATGDDVVAVIDRNPAIVCVFGPDRNKEVLSNPQAFRHDEDLFRGPPGSALEVMRSTMVAINGETHKRHRRLVMPAFAKSALESYARDMVEVTEQVTARWPRAGVAQLDALCRELALCVAVKCLYGLDVRDGAPELGRLAADLVDTMTSPAAIMARVNIPGTPYARMLRLCEQVLAQLGALIEQKKRAGGAQRDAMALLMNARDDDGTGLSRDELLAEATTLFVAGHDTTAATLAWTLFLLDQHPDVLARVQAELERELGGRAPTLDDLPRLVELDRVIKESMRVLAPVPVLFMRACAEGAKVGGYALPRGANVLVSPLVTHHDPALYPDPRAFRPERWATLAPPPYAYLPFGAGPRTCVGALFAAQAVRLVLPVVLQRFRFRTAPGTRVSRLVRGNILHFKHGLPARVESPRGAPAPAARVRGDVHELVALPRDA